MITPTWHRGTWTQAQHLDLLEELDQAQQVRSLTAEEQAWLAQVQGLEEQE